MRPPAGKRFASNYGLRTVFRWGVFTYRPLFTDFPKQVLAISLYQRKVALTGIDLAKVYDC
jgi:hypothetical protein